jgi:hypothetical protein
VTDVRFADPGRRAWRCATAPSTTVYAMPKLWLYTQIAVVVFVLAGIVIAITRLA